MQAGTIGKQLEALREKRKKAFAVLVDPDKVQAPQLDRLLEEAKQAQVDYFFVGGSLLTSDRMEACLEHLSRNSRIPKLLFPGDHYQVSRKADGILFLSLLSGRNPELLIGRQVTAAPYLYGSGLEILPTGYLLIDGGRPTTASYMSGTQPIPADKPEIAWATALAGQMLGMQLIYLDAGSGARNAVRPEVIRAVREGVDRPLIVGGGIREPEAAERAIRAGADLVVVGNAIERDPGRMRELAAAVHGTRDERVGP